MSRQFDVLAMAVLYMRGFLPSEASVLLFFFTFPLPCLNLNNLRHD